MSYDYSENILVQESAGNLLHDELGWDVQFAYNTEVLGKDGTFGRTSYREILLVREVRSALRRLNSWLTDAQADEAIGALLHTLSTASLMQINEEKYFLLRDGIPVTVKRPDGKTEIKRAAVLDFQNPAGENNHFLAVKELKIHGDLYRRRTDIVGFVNGIPLLFVELKKNTVDVQNAYTDNYTDYLDTIPHLFYYNAFLMLSNGEEAKVGTLGSTYEFFHEWKRLDESDSGSVELETMLRGICQKENFLDLFANFILYDHSGGKTVKILARNHQYLGVNEAIKKYENRKLNDGKLGVFWHTQGSGKSYSMLFFAQKVRRTFAGSPTFVVLTDRDELNRQISDTFENCGLLGKTKASQYIATSGEDLIAKLKSNPGFIFTLIHKFNRSDVEPIYPDHDIIVLSDEAHRSQYGMLAENMTRLLPTASKLGFTGTPLLSDDEITARTFGGYVSVYDFRRAVEDGATVPLYYENRGKKLSNIKNPEINDKILDAIEQADLDEEHAEKLEQEFAKEIHILTNNNRLREIAKDFVRHYSDLWTSGKAMFVCLNKVTCGKMYNFVQEYWREEIQTLQKQLRSASQQEAQEIERKLNWMQETEMAVVVSQEQNEIQKFAKWGLDIRPHREKMEKRDLDKEFKDPQNPFRIVFVCAMWLTGFDVKCLSCLYLDKPLKAHTLMQTIARANRVYEGKSNGLIIDYIGIVEALRKALADYTKNRNGSGQMDPTQDHEQLIERFVEIVNTAKEYLRNHDFCLQDLIDAENFNKIAQIQFGANAVCGNIEDKKTYSTYASELKRLKKFIDRQAITETVCKEADAILAIYAELNKKRRHADNTDLMIEIQSILDDYISVEDQSPDDQSIKFDISQIDFDLLSREFSRVHKRNLLLRDLQDLIEQKLADMMQTNPCRIDFYERYQAIIQEHNAGMDRSAIEKTFIDLMNLANSMGVEEQRYVREGFSSDEELSVYDLLFRDDLSKSDIKKIKDLSVELLQKIKAKIAELDHWTDKQDTKAAVDNLIRDVLWTELPECYDEESVIEYRKKIYEYVYSRYKNVA